MKTYKVTISQITKKGKTQELNYFIIQSNFDKTELLDFYEKSFIGFWVSINEIPIQEVICREDFLKDEIFNDILKENEKNKRNLKSFRELASNVEKEKNEFKKEKEMLENNYRTINYIFKNNKLLRERQELSNTLHEKEIEIKDKMIKELKEKHPLIIEVESTNIIPEFEKFDNNYQASFNLRVEFKKYFEVDNNENQSN